MSEAMSTCASCSRKFPTAPPDHVHKCVCGGKMVPDPAPLGMSGGEPAGWMLVPVEPTAEMVEAAVEHWHTHNDLLDEEVKGTYAAMLAATPTPPIEGRDADVERELRVAKAIARANGDEFANAFANKTRWIAKRGMSGGRFRDANEPFQSDYLAMARAALQALGERG